MDYQNNNYFYIFTIMKNRVLALIALAAFLTAGCSDEKTFSREWTDAEMSLSKEQVNVGEIGTTATVEVETEEVDIDATVGYVCKSWLTAKVSGKTVTMTVIGNNPTVDERNGSVLITAGSKGKTVQRTVTVVQAGADPSTIPTLTLDKQDVRLDAAANSSATITVTTNQSPVTVKVSSSASEWLSATITEGVITVTAVSTNSESTIRTGIVTVAAGDLTKEISVSQVPGESYIGTPYGTEGIVFWQSPENPKQVKIISAFAEKMAWAEFTDATGAKDDGDSGVPNNELVKAHPDYATKASVVKYCAEKGTGWYMPSVTELKILFEAYNGTTFDGATNANPDGITEAEKASRAAFEAAMASISGVKINSGAASAAGDSIWACRETSADVNAWYIRFGKVLSNNGVKSSTARFGRCVKVVTIE